MPFPNPKHFRKKTNWLAAVGSEALSPALRAYARRKTGEPTAPARWSKALILGANHLGDLLYVTASLETLKVGLPDCAFHYLTAPGSAPILEGNPAIAGILPWARSDNPLDLAPEHFAALEAMAFDAALCINSGMIWQDLLLSIRLGIPNRVACVDKGFSGWATFPVSLRRPQPYPAYFRDYVAALTGLNPGRPLRPVIYTNERDQADADAVWARLGLDRRPPVTVCFMTSRQPTGIWPSAKFGETLMALRSRCDTHIVLCGAAADEPILAAVNLDYGLDGDVIAGSLGIRSLCCFLRRCPVVLTSDSGPRHIANAAGVPVVFVRNVWFHAVEAGPYLPAETDLCGPPRDGACGDGPELLAAIDPERAADIVAGILAKS